MNTDLKCSLENKYNFTSFHCTIKYGKLGQFIKMGGKINFTKNVTYMTMWLRMDLRIFFFKKKKLDMSSGIVLSYSYILN